MGTSKSLSKTKGLDMAEVDLFSEVDKSYDIKYNVKKYKDVVMTKVISASQARANIYNLIDETAQNHEPVLITGKRNNVVMLSQEDWNAIEETLYLNSVPELAKSIQDSMKATDEEFSENIEW